MIDLTAIDRLARPVVDLLAAFGNGALPAGSAAAAIRATSDTLDAGHMLARTAVHDLGGVWTGTAADAALDKAQAAQTASVRLSDRGREIAAIVEAASETVRTGTVELQALLDSFLRIASSALPLLTTPAGQSLVIGAAFDHLGRALAVVERVRADLAVHTAAMIVATEPDPIPAAPQPAVAPVHLVRAIADPYLAAPTPALGNAAAAATSHEIGSAGFTDVTSYSSATAAGSSAYDPRFGGSGVEIVLPDGSTAVAPNEEAAAAVRNALSQQGVPYVWGGTSPGQGLDCSGLTQWAYGEAGVDLPRLAQEQNVGVPVGADNLLPGDLVVWDGHVAMVIGNGQMIEAGDPVSVTSIRTTNSGMSFSGFYRPTE